MPSKKLDIQIEQGATFFLTVNAKNPDGTIKNLTGYTARMQVRNSVNASTTLVDATTTNGLITVIAAQGQVTVSIPATTTDSYTWYNGVYDLEIQSLTNEVTRLLSGNVSVIRQVTR